MLPYTMPNGAKNITVNEQKIATDSDKNNFFNIVFDLFPELSEFKISSPFHGAFKGKITLTHRLYHDGRLLSTFKT